jgi:hypothetical protein
MKDVDNNKGGALMKNETVEEFMARGGKVTKCADKNARGAQKPQTIKVCNTFSQGRKAFSIGTGSKGISRNLIGATPESKIVEQISWKRSYYGGKKYTQFKKA